MKKYLILALLLSSRSAYSADDDEKKKKEALDFDFNPQSIKRDPFQPPSEIAVDTRTPLLRFDVAEFKLVAIMTGLGPSQALLMLPDKSTETVKKGDKIGKNGGVVSKISMGEIVIRETYVDYRGREKSEISTLKISEE